MWLLINNIHEKIRDGYKAEETHAYHAIREKLRHKIAPSKARALDLKAKDLIGSLKNRIVY